jgi:hypothetical protein
MAILRNNSQRPHRLGRHIELAPGQATEVKDEHWAEARELAVVQHHIKSGEIEELKGKAARVAEEVIANENKATTAPSPALVASPENLEHLPAHDAIDFISKSSDETALARWRKDPRKTVHEAAAARLKELK